MIGTSATVTEPDTPVTFEDRSTGEPTSRTWSFGDGATSTERRPTHRWRTPGRYRVTLSVARGDERADTALTVVVSDGLLASFSAPGSAETGQPVTFTNQSTGDIAEYRWDFGDGSAGSTERSPSHVYRSAGRYTVRLTVVEPAVRRTAPATPSRPATLRSSARTGCSMRRRPSRSAAVAVSIEVSGAPVTVAVASGPCRLVRRDLDGAVARHIVGATAPGPCALDVSQPASGDVTGAPAQTVNLTAVAPPTAQNRPPEVRWPGRRAVGRNPLADRGGPRGERSRW
ncbi:MAG: PKD domain-containing protein [Acidimicrobiales bacterium]